MSASQVRVVKKVGLSCIITVEVNSRVSVVKALVEALKQAQKSETAKTPGHPMRWTLETKA